MDTTEINRLQKYLQEKFGNNGLTVKVRKEAPDSLEVLLNGEFMGTIYKDVDEGETSYDFNMAILDIDLSATA